MIVSIDDLSADSAKILTAWGDMQKVKVLSLRDSEQLLPTHSCLISQKHRTVEALGKASPIAPIPATREQIASICYTSVGHANTASALL